MKKLSQEEAEKVLEGMKVKIKVPKAAVTQWERNAALDMAIEALKYSEVPNSSDCISRQAAIDVLKGLPTWWADEGGYYGGAQPPMVALLDPEDAVSAIENLPSAQPEIVRCKDCKYGEQDEVGRWFCRSLGCQIGDEDGSGFCADGERRADA